MKEKKLRLLTLTGGPRERGLNHGEEMREEIARHLELWREDLAKDTGMSPADYLDKFYAETDFFPALQCAGYEHDCSDGRHHARRYRLQRKRD